MDSRDEVETVQTSIIRSTGFWAPPDVITNAELVASYNAYAARFNTENSDAIAAGEIAAVPLSSAEFITNTVTVTAGIITTTTTLSFTFRSIIN